MKCPIKDELRSDQYCGDKTDQNPISRENLFGRMMQCDQKKIAKCL